MAKNIITEQRYNKIKPHIGNPKDDSKNKKKFGIGQSVIRDIRNTKNFAEYKKRGATYRSMVKEGKAILDRYDELNKLPSPYDEPLDAEEFFSGKSLQPVEDAKKKSQIIDICVLVAIAIMIVIVLILGGK